MNAAPKFAFQTAEASHVGVAPAEFRRALGRYATGVTIMTALDAQGAPYGVTATSFGSLSLDPPLIQWSLGKASSSHRVFDAAERFVVNMLAEDQAELSTRFATSGIDRFAGTAYEEGLDGLPLLIGCTAWLECDKEFQVAGGDHTLIVGRVRRAAAVDRPPLLHLRGAYGAFEGFSNS